MIKICFHTPQIDVRGTSDAIYWYGHYNETILNNKSIILVPEDSKFRNDEIAFLKFQNRFEIRFYKDKKDIDNIISDCDILYCIKYGKDDGIKSDKIKTVIHCVFDMSEPHGNVYAAVSKTLAKKFRRELFIPHMIGLEPSITKENLRENLGIPQNAIVFGRHGGLDTFDLFFARLTISRIVRENSNIYFLFINTPVFDNHPQIIFLPKIVETSDKNKFINTCDAHIECGSLGHTFGISIGEFSVNNKPIIVYNGPIWNRAHIDILGNKGIYYQNEDEFYNILTTFKVEEWINKDNNHYKDYSPENVMKKFQEVFIN